MGKIGNTPVVEIEPGMHAKLEGCNPSKSHKDRALTALLLNDAIQGNLDGPSTLCLTTSGSAGRSLAYFHQALSKINSPQDFQLDLNIIIPLAYMEKPGPASITSLDGLNIYTGGFDEFFAKNDHSVKGKINLIFEDMTFKETLAKAGGVARDKEWVIVDQHNDASGLHAHASTAHELLEQVPGLTDIVCTTGTGAVAAGLTHYLPEGVQVHSRPAMSGTIEGLTDIRDYNNFCDASGLVGYEEGYLSSEKANNYQEKLAKDHGIYAGPSSGSCYWLAKKLKQEDPSRKIAFICADGVLEQVKPKKEWGLPKIRTSKDPDHQSTFVQAGQKQQHQHVQEVRALHIFDQLQEEANEALKNEPELESLLKHTVLAPGVKSFEDAVAMTVSHRMLSEPPPNNVDGNMIRDMLFEAFDSDVTENGHTMSEAVRLDALAFFDQDPACESILEVVLFFKGFAALVCHRAAYRKWQQNHRSISALLLQSQTSALFGVDIHPAATIGAGIMLDHGNGIVIGETAKVGDNCVLLHGVTLGGTGKNHVDRHPKLGDNVLIGANTSILGNITIGDRSKIGAGSIVLKPIPADSTAVGAPAKIIRSSFQEADVMDTAMAA